MMNRARWTTERRVKPEFDNELPSLISRPSQETDAEEREEEEEDDDSIFEDEVPGAFAVRLGDESNSAREFWDPTEAHTDVDDVVPCTTFSRQPSAGLGASSHRPQLAAARTRGTSVGSLDSSSSRSSGGSVKSIEASHLHWCSMLRKCICQRSIVILLICFIVITVLMTVLVSQDIHIKSPTSQTDDNVVILSDSPSSKCFAFGLSKPSRNAAVEKLFAECFCPGGQFFGPFVDESFHMTYAALNDTLSRVGVRFHPSRCDASTKALVWAAASTHPSVPVWKKLNRFALAHFFLSFDGFAWIRASRWMSTRDECEWFGVVCYDHSDAIGLALPSNELRGEFNTVTMESLRLLNLKKFNIERNWLSGMMPLFHHMSSLEEFDCSRNPITGSISSTTVQGLTSLRSFVAEANFLTGTIPKTLFLLDSLQNLDVGHQRDITGTIPHEVGLLTTLTSLGLSELSLNGTLPTSIGLLTNLKRFRCNGNVVTGSLPTEVGLLTRLELLDTRSTLLGGDVPSEIYRLTNLKHLMLETGYFQGAISTAIGSLTNLVDLIFSWNSMSGTLPTEMGNLVALEQFGLSGNNDISGTFPTEIASLPALRYVDVLGTTLTGPVPDSLYNRSAMDLVRVSCRMTCRPDCPFRRDCPSIIDEGI